jgi:hypothetical protein
MSITLPSRCWQRLRDLRIDDSLVGDRQRAARVHVLEMPLGDAPAVMPALNSVVICAAALPESKQIDSTHAAPAPPYVAI